MSVLDTTYQETLSFIRKTWCDENRNALYDYLTDFNEWIDGEDWREIKERYLADDFSQQSKAIYYCDAKICHQVFNKLLEEKTSQGLIKEFIGYNFGGLNLFERNQKKDITTLKNCYSTNLTILLS